ncbi:DNA (cytosine-5-)-methyltransferase [Bacillus infantis]|uniref:DNA (cytosine-5-)-methyltransferase n=1 Tax=Bacillus infantis TaxID=324767 RepID=UPI00209E2BC5|nr:DNA (cytosine-5-)-methyltransferase [Bacillus infantis]MCP1157011.1 DNA (cytosine-5-)-methyltransferase [Bacillus infantis]
MNKNLNVVELFAGVGGFRVGLERADENFFNTVWANQWEPSKKAQDAFNCYNSHFPSSVNCNDDIGKVSNKTFEDMNIDLLVGGFPCQDYSVARSLSKEQGIQGIKGVLFWEIKRIVEVTHPKYILLENVDRLLKSPSKQRGRDFSIMLATFRDLGYIVEWRVINAAEYGTAQRRRRIFIFAYDKSLAFAEHQLQKTTSEILLKDGFFASTFPVKEEIYKNRDIKGELPKDIVEISDEFSFLYHPSGIMIEGKFHTVHTEAQNPHSIPLKAILQDESEVDEKFYLSEASIEKFTYLRGPKKIERTTKDGHKYVFSEGGMSPVDSLDLPGRTMLTSEGTTNRSSHIVEVNGRKRFLTPIECERLNGFPDNWTATMGDRMRYFCMGNALVTDLIEKMGNKIKEIDAQETHDVAQISLNL